jgi:hypothetical protein
MTHSAAPSPCTAESSDSCSSTPESTDRPPLDREQTNDIRRQPREAYPSSSLQRTSAPALTSTSKVSMWPFCDAACSAVLLHSRKQPLLQLHTRVDGPSAPALSSNLRHEDAARGTAPVVALAVHVRAQLDQRHRRLRVAVLRRIVQRRPPAQPKQPLLQLHTRVDGPSAPVLSQPIDTRIQCEGPYPSFSVQCTSTPASTSAIAVSVWPFNDA